MTPQSDPVKRRAYLESWRQKNRDRLLVKESEWRKTHREYQRRSRIKFNYGLTLEDIDRMKATQGNACAICGTEFGPKPNDIHIDHDHGTGAVRGLLCNKCNHGIGLFQDSPILLRLAIAYLSRRIQ